MPQISLQTEKLIEQYQKWHKAQKPKEGVSTIHVDEVASKVAAFYEKIREIVDWKEEHLMRRAAIQRILKRRLLLKNNQADVAQPFVLELIRGGHFPNDKIEEAKIQEVQRIIDKYVFILQRAPQNPENFVSKGLSRGQLYNWILSICACEIEHTLSPALRETALIEYMEQIMRERIKLKNHLPEKEKNRQIYIAVQRALFNLDKSIITYHLLKRSYSNWRNLNRQELEQIAADVYLIWQQIEDALSHPLADKFYRICEKQDTAYLLLNDILSKDIIIKAKKKIVQPRILENLVREAYSKRLRTLKNRVRRAAIYATLSIFLTNIVSLLAIEIPFTKYITGHLNSLAITIDIFGPTLLMAVLVGTIRPPKKENMLRAIIEVMKIVYQKEKQDIYEIKLFPKRGFLINAIILLFYLAGFCISLGLIIWGLSLLRFPLLSYIIFIIFLSLIAFAGAKIRERARELEMIEKKEGLLHIIIDPLSVPIVQFGKWLSQRWQKYNVISVFFNFLIDMPFVIFIEFLEHWRYFLKEKKEEIH